MKRKMDTSLVVEESVNDFKKHIEEYEKMAMEDEPVTLGTDEQLFSRTASNIITDILEGNLDSHFAAFLSAESETALSNEEMGRIFHKLLMDRVASRFTRGIDNSKAVRDTLSLAVQILPTYINLASKAPAGKSLMDITEKDTRTFWSANRVTVNGTIIPEVHSWQEIVYTAIIGAIIEIYQGNTAEELGATCGDYELSAEFVYNGLGNPSWMGRDPAQMKSPITLNAAGLFYDRAADIWEVIHTLQTSKLLMPIRYEMYIEFDEKYINNK